MTVFVVMKTHIETFTTCNSYDEDGYYDDYYDTEVESSELVGIYMSMINAIKAVEKAEDEDANCRVCLYPYDITDKPDTNNDILKYIQENPDSPYFIGYGEYEKFGGTEKDKRFELKDFKSFCSYKGYNILKASLNPHNSQYRIQELDCDIRWDSLKDCKAYISWRVKHG